MSAPATLFGRRLRERLWGLELELSDAELSLLRSPLLTRLHRIRQAGPGALTTGETFTRLQHVLGVVALAGHLVPGDAELRLAALLHDVGHLPLSHALEGVGGLDHHALGRARLAEAGPAAALGAAGVDARRVTALALGDEPSPLRPAGGRLGLDHLDGIVRCADAHGWTAGKDGPAGVDLGAVAVRDGALVAAPATADALARLALENARWHRHPANVGPVAVVRDLAGRLLETGAANAAGVARLADDELWALLLAAPATAAGTRRLLDAPWTPAVRAGDEPAGAGELVLDAPPAYVPRPAATLSPDAEADLAAAAALPRRFLVRP